MSGLIKFCYLMIFKIRVMRSPFRQVIVMKTLRIATLALYADRI